MTRPSIAFAEDTLPYLVDDANYPTGGWAVELLGWLEGLKQLNKSVVLTWKGANEVAGEHAQVEFIEAWDSQLDKGGFRHFYRFVPAVSYALRNHDIDIMIQACARMATFLYGWAARRAGKKFVYRVVNDVDVDERIKDWLKPYEYYTYQIGLRMADAFICQNDYQATQLKKRFPDAPQFTIHNPYKALATPEWLEQERPYIAWLGVFSQQKNLPLLIELASRTPNVLYKVAGMPAKSTDKETLAAFETLKTLHNVDYVGYTKRTQVPTFLHNASALLNTSHYEGFSNTFLESLAVGTPIITSVGVDPDNILVDNNLGFVVDGADAYVEAITTVIDGGEMSSEGLAQRCRQFVHDHHSPRTQAERFLDQLETALKL